MIKSVIFLLCLILVVPASAAWRSDGNDTVDITDHAILDLPEGDWSRTLWVKINNNGGTASINILMSNNVATGSNPGWFLYCTESSAASVPGTLSARINDDDTTDRLITSTNTICNNTTWQHVVFQRESNVLKLYVGNSEEATVTLSTADDTSANPGTLRFFAFTDGDNGINDAEVCDFAGWNRALTSAERAMLAKRFPAGFIPQGLQFWVQAIREFIEVKVPLTLTNNTATVTPCPGLYYPY